MKYKISIETVMTLRCILGDAQQFLGLLEELYVENKKNMYADAVREKIKQIEVVINDIEYSKLEKVRND